jgi:hypothetical protein
MRALPDRFRGEIAGILDQRFYPLAWVEQQIAAGQIGIVENETACIGVETRIYPGGASELHGMFAAGELDGILQLIDAACDQAARLGFTVAAIESRSAWGRILKSRGFETDRVRIVRELG